MSKHWQPKFDSHARAGKNGCRLAGFKSMELNVAQETKTMASETMHQKTAEYERGVAAADLARLAGNR